MKKLFIGLSVFLVMGCSTQKNSTSKSSLGKTSSKSPIGDTRTKEVSSIDEITYLLEDSSTDKTYGYTQTNPIKVGGYSNGPSNERRFLNGLLGPNGEKIQYHREGSCCAFKTPNGLFDNTGLLDLYKVYWDGCKDTLNIYINMYDKGNLLIPVGLTGKKK